MISDFTKHTPNEFSTKFVSNSIQGRKWDLCHPYTKKGVRLTCENYRGITVTSTVCRLYGRTLSDIMEEEYKEKEAEEQSGFNAGRSCMDNIFCLKQIIKKEISTGRELYLLFIDFSKAYDSIPIEKLWEALEQTNINHTVIKAQKTF